jgi:acetylornithine deacetylase
MAFDSTQGREEPVVAFAEQLLRSDRWQTIRIPVSPGRNALFASSGEEPRFTLSTHLDTVPPHIPPVLDGDVLRGRGACDAKGIAAAMIVAGSRLRDRGLPMALLFVIGEETTHDGAHAANRWAAMHLPAGKRVLINGEPTGNTLAVGTKGAIRVVVRTTGRAAHSAYPGMGRSATRDLVQLLADLEGLALPHDPLLGETTVNIGTLTGGVADNVVAPIAEARLMIRLVTPAEAIQPIFEQWAEGRAALTWGVTAPPVRLGVVPGFETSVVAYTTDVGALGNWGEPYLLGPGSIHVAHADDEHVRIDALEEAVALYQRLVEGIASGMEPTG